MALHWPILQTLTYNLTNIMMTIYDFVGISSCRLENRLKCYFGVIINERLKDNLPGMKLDRKTVSR